MSDVIDTATIVSIAIGNFEPLGQGFSLLHAQAMLFGIIILNGR